MRDIHCPKDIGFENTFSGEDCEKEQYYNNCYHCWSTALAKGKANKTPTNGDMIKILFPNAEYKIVRKLSGCDYVEVRLDGYNRHQFELDWWNAPYRERQNEDSD